ncbi:MAG: nucleotidyltransferase family protein [Pseudomonadota bacterium]
MALLERLPYCAPEAWVVSGCLFQSAWNHLTGRPPDHGILDYDVFYFDDGDVSWEAEDAIIRRVAEACADLSINVEVRNQARVHLWYEQKFGMPYPPLLGVRDSIDRFLATACMVGIRADGTAAPAVYAPAGLSDLEALIVRPNRAPNFSPLRYGEKAARWGATWPELTIIPA